MFDPVKDAEPTSYMSRVLWWAKHCLFGIPIVQIAQSAREDEIKVAEEIAHAASQCARYPSMVRQVTLRTWLYYAKKPGAENHDIAKKVSPRLREWYEEQDLIRFLHYDHSFSMQEIEELLRAG